MKVSIVGIGYVGLVTGTCFSETGLTVTCVDIDKEKIEGLEAPIAPTYTDDFEALRDEHGMEAVETQMQNINKEIADTEASLREGLYDVEGRLAPDKDSGGHRIWTRQDGTSAANFEITAETVKFLSTRSESEGGYTADSSPAVSEPEDIPF